MNKVCLSFCSNIFLELALYIFPQHGVRGPCGVVYDSQIFWKSCFSPNMGKIDQAQSSLKKFSFFFLSSLFFINLVYNESSCYCNSCMLQEMLMFGKILIPETWSKMLLAVSQKEINEINCFLLCPSNSFLRNGSLGFSDFWHNGR